MAERRFSDDEVERILVRAAELQQGAARVAGGDGATLDELQAIADEAQIDRALVLRAARELETRAPESVALAGTQRSRLLGGPERVVIERTIAGELAASRFDRVLEEIRRATGEIGEVERGANSLTWKSGSGEAKGVVVTARDGQTTVRAVEKLDAVIGSTWGLITFLGGAALMVPLLLLFALLELKFLVPLAIILPFPLMALVGRRRFVSAAAEHEAALAQLVERVTALASDGADEDA